MPETAREIYGFAFTLSGTLSAGITISALVMLIFGWRRLPRRLLSLAPWIVLLVLAIWLHHRPADEKKGYAVLLASLATLLAIAGLESWQRVGRPGLLWTSRQANRQEVPHAGAKRWLFETVTVLACGLAWTLLLPRDMVTNGQRVAHDALVSYVIAPVTEEFTYRLGIEGILVRLTGARRWSVPLAIVVSAVMWALFHREPQRLLELVPAGLMFGWLQARQGTEACILAHAGHNAALRALAIFIRAH